MPQPGDLIAQKYRIERLLGQGGMGAVFEARHTVIQKSVALKWLRPDLSTDPEFIHRLIREARAAGRVHHPNVLAVHDVGEHEGSLFLVMEYLRGAPLESLIASGPLPWQQALAVLLPAMRGVHAAHLRGVLHRDLKPANIFMCEDDQGQPIGPKVLDFGISKIVDARYEDGASTETGAQLGTPAYMSPEALRGDKVADERGDVYAFGVILYRVLSGRLPFTGATSSAIAINAVTTEPPPLASLSPGLPPSLVAVVERAMARDRSRRFPSVAALIEALEPLDTGAPTPRNAIVFADASQMHTTTSGMASVALGRGSRVPWLAGSAVLVVLAVAAVYSVATHSPSQERTAVETPSAARAPSTPSAAVARHESTMDKALPAPSSGAKEPRISVVTSESPATTTRPEARVAGHRPRARGTPSGVPATTASAPPPAGASTTNAPPGSVHLKADDF